MDIVFIRHGRTEANEKGVYGGFTDVPLSETGKVQAERAAKLIKDKSFSEIYVSPLKRTIETSSILGLKGKYDDRIKEMNFGIFEGLSYREIEKKYPEEARKWSSDFLNYKIHGGESLMEVYKRVVSFMEDISKKEGTILVITHEGVIKCALSFIFERPEYFYRFKVSCCSLTQIAYEDKYYYIKAINASMI